MMRVMHLSPEEKDEKQAMEKLIKETLEGLMLPEALQETQADLRFLSLSPKPSQDLGLFKSNK